MRRRLPPILLAALANVGAVAAATDCPAEAQGYQRIKTADAEIAYRWEPADLKVGQFFAAEVVACRAPGPEPVGAIAIDAIMPAHGHGMNYRPAAARAGAGHYRFTGLMLHMPGTWRITFDLVQGSRRTRLAHEVSLKP
jgi:hypothetical protein